MGSIVGLQDEGWAQRKHETNRLSLNKSHQAPARTREVDEDRLNGVGACKCETGGKRRPRENKFT